MKSPLLDYFGGKWRLAPKIIKLIPEHKTFVDLMCGAASLTFRKPKSKNEVINDLHSELYNLFKILREQPEDLKRSLTNTPYSREEYEACRQSSSNPLEQARRTIVKSWFGIGDSLDNPTGFRVPLLQRGSVTNSWINYVNHLDQYSERLRSVILENLDYKEVLKKYDKPETLFYIDPPYLINTRSKKKAYKHEWTLEQHQELCEIVKTLKAKVMISGYLGEPYTTLGFKQHILNPKTVNKDPYLAAKSKSHKIEYIWTNF